MDEFFKKKHLILKFTLVVFGIVVFLTSFIKIEYSANSFSHEQTEKISQVRNTEKFQGANPSDSQLTENKQEYDVIKLQTKLNQKISPGATDKVDRKKTGEAVDDFQMSLELTATGKVDPETSSFMEETINSNSFPQNSFSVDLLSPDIKKIIDRGKLIVAMIEYDNAPFFVKNERGELEGLDIKIAQGLAQSLGVEVQLNRSARTFNEVVKIVAQGEADLAISKLSQTLNRAKKISFSNPYVTLRHGFLLNRLQLTKAAKNQDTAEFLRNFEGKIGVINGSSYEMFAKQKFPNATIVSYGNWEDVIKGAIKGDILAAYRDELEVKKIVINQPNVALKFQTVALKDTQDPIAIALPWSSNHLLEFVNLYLKFTETNYSVNSVLSEYSELLEKSSLSKLN
ncbi:MAG: transporter substrate-binding domain-containing protein [Okeania sp. SIO3I5]|uniref:transporter substrate-binding domain-containing protein n=1 Tax=Okeania sp. SIO3I5 TaxID=2607805 RepID=UPI0013B608BD|nr:transporter substrate-binding domain-containing protein [Okeania sp. SIO3I5]NEQ40198.1 transporter substrate-binding domain-containing protein [Okeania sp. SIO3I5]